MPRRLQARRLEGEHRQIGQVARRRLDQIARRVVQLAQWKQRHRPDEPLVAQVQQRRFAMAQARRHHLDHVVVARLAVGVLEVTEQGGRQHRRHAVEPREAAVVAGLFAHALVGADAPERGVVEIAHGGRHSVPRRPARRIHKRMRNRAKGAVLYLRSTRPKPRDGITSSRRATGCRRSRRPSRPRPTGSRGHAQPRSGPRPSVPRDRRSYRRRSSMR